MIPISCYSSLCLILIAVTSFYSNVYHISEVGSFHSGLALISDGNEVTCLTITHRRHSHGGLTSIQVADASVSLSDHIKLYGITLDNRLSCVSKSAAQ